MDILKKFVLLTITLAVVAGLFFVGIAFFAIVLILFPVVYFYQRYKMKDFLTEAAQARAAQQPENKQAEVSGSKIIEAEFEVIEEEKK